MGGKYQSFIVLGLTGAMLLAALDGSDSLGARRRRRNPLDITPSPSPAPSPSPSPTPDQQAAGADAGTDNYEVGDNYIAYYPNEDDRNIDDIAEQVDDDTFFVSAHGDEGTLEETDTQAFLDQVVENVVEGNYDYVYMNVCYAGAQGPCGEDSVATQLHNALVEALMGTDRPVPTIIAPTNVVSTQLDAEGNIRVEVINYPTSMTPVSPENGFVAVTPDNPEGTPLNIDDVLNRFDAGAYYTPPGNAGYDDPPSE